LSRKVERSETNPINPPFASAKNLVNPKILSILSKKVERSETNPINPQILSKKPERSETNPISKNHFLQKNYENKPKNTTFAAPKNVK
jgi:hypothetical protein